MSAAPELPAHIRKHLENIARTENLAEFTISHVAGCNKGEGFMSDMLSVTLAGTRSAANGKPVDHRLALICKRPPVSLACQEEFKSPLVFEREAFMYNSVLPRLERLQREHGICERDGFYAYPKCYVADFDPAKVAESVIIMQDLRSLGYRLWPKERTTTVANTRLLLQQLGRLHGLSFVLRDQQPEVFAEFEAIGDLLAPIALASGFRTMFTAAYDRAIDVLKAEGERSIMRRIRDSYDQLLPRLFNLNALGKGAVLSHGDCWSNNMMFTFNEDVATDIALVDWQISHMCSPVVDLTNYLLSATDKPMRDAHLGDFLRFYHATVAQTIRAFGSDPEQLFPVAEFERQQREFGYYGILMAPMVLPVRLADPKQIRSMADMADNLQSGDSLDTHMAALTETSEHQYRQLLSDCIRDSQEYGWLDAIE